MRTLFVLAAIPLALACNLHKGGDDGGADAAPEPEATVAPVVVEAGPDAAPAPAAHFTAVKHDAGVDAGASDAGVADGGAASAKADAGASVAGPCPLPAAVVAGHFCTPPQIQCPNTKAQTCTCTPEDKARSRWKC